MARDFSGAHEQIERARRFRAAVEKESLRRLVEVMQTPRSKGGSLPVETGFLRSSLVAHAGKEAPQVREKSEGWIPGDTGDVTLVLATLHPGEPVTIAYTASYAVHVHWGTRSMRPTLWVSLAVQRLPVIVQEVAREARARLSI